MALAYAQYFLFAYIIFAVLCFVTTGRSYAAVLTFGDNMPIRIVFEVIIGLVIVKGLNAIGDRYIFRDGELVHPVPWTWYSTYLLIVQLIRGILAGVVRVVMMCLWIVIQIGVMDRSNFPEGQARISVLVILNRLKIYLEPVSK